MKTKKTVILTVAVIVIAATFTGYLLDFNEQTDDQVKNYEVSERKTEIKELGSVVTSKRLSPGSLMQKVEAAEVPSDESTIDLTVYNQDLGLVKDRRKLDLKQGKNLVEFQDVASQIDPTSVHFKSLTAPAKTSVTEQNYEYDLINQDKLLEKYLGEEIVVKTENKSYRGELLSKSRGLVLDLGDQIVSLTNYENIKYPKLPQGLRIKPTLVWQLQTQKSGEHDVEVSYLTSDINWNANYVAVVNKNEEKIDLNGWVTIDNNCGTDFADANLKLVAGDINQVEEREKRGRLYDYQASARGAREEQFEQEKLFEYHMYSLQRKTDVKNKQEKQISLFETSEVPTKKEFVFEQQKRYYYGNDDQEGKVKVMLNLDNKKENGLGIPLPKGVVRVYKKDSSGQLQFLGEDRIDHTPKNEPVRLYVGDAFDVTADRKVMNEEEISDDAEKRTIKVELKNHKKEDIKVTVKENLPTEWEIKSKNYDYKKIDANTIEFKVPVPKEGEATLEYTYLHTW